MLAIAAVVALNVNLNVNSSKLSDIALVNIEALAEVELPEVIITCDSYADECFKGSSRKGQCWVPDRITGLSIQCKFSGKMSDYCCWSL